ncbi:hypothetical protein F5Y04DRAFT_128107 [Hypomontagnella monticulosa]|nr:hypothetical protein F5Y04DRAFT_128107 [Hypomontagnella monticulosa]
MLHFLVFTLFLTPVVARPKSTSPLIQLLCCGDGNSSSCYLKIRRISCIGTWYLVCGPPKLARALGPPLFQPLLFQGGWPVATPEMPRNATPFRPIQSMLLENVISAMVDQGRLEVIDMTLPLSRRMTNVISKSNAMAR